MAEVALLMQSAVNGGVQRVMINLAQGLVNLGVSVDFIICDARGEMRSIIPEECNIIDCKKENVRGDAKVAASIIPIYQYMRDNPGTVMIGAPGLAGTVLSFLRMLKKNSPVIVILDNKVSLLKGRSLYHSVVYYINKIFFQFADKIIAAHKAVAEDVVQNFHINCSKIKTIYHPLIDWKKIDTCNLQVNHRFFDEGVKVAVAVGRLVPEKDFENLIQSMEFVNRHDLLKLIILGDGPKKNELQKRISDLNLQDKVDLYGYTDNVFGFIKKADLLVLSSREEAFGNVLVEALACGKPIVTTNCSSGGPKDIIDGENAAQYGAICECGNSKTLADAILKVLHRTYDPNNLRNRANKFEIMYSAREYHTEIIRLGK